MSSRYQYKETGLDWIGEIPSHWNLISLKNAFYVIPSNVDKRSEDDEIEVQLCNYVDVYYNDFINLSLEFMTATATEAEIKKFQLEVADVLITKDSEDPFDIAVPAYVTEVKEKLLCGYHLSLLRSSNKKINGSYLFWALKDEKIVTQLWREACGVTRWAIASRHIKNSVIPFPIEEEQTAIANYLDKACKDIDKAIELKEEQFKKTEKLFFSFLDEIFSGRHTYRWVEERLKDISKINPSVEEDLTDDTLVTVIPMECVSEMGDVDASEVVQFKDAVNGLNYFRNGDVLFAKITPCMENGKGAFVENLTTELAFGSTEFFVVRPSSKILGKFIYYYTRAERFRMEAEANMKGAAGQQRVTPRYFNSSVIRYPKTIEEQKAVIAKIDIFRKRNENLLQLLRDQINTLSEYKKSLIHEVVTGKKQVYFEEAKANLSKSKNKLPVAT